VSTESFRAWFEQTFGAPIPLVVDVDLHRSPGGTHWATELRPELSASAQMIPVFVEAIDPYVVTGAWGHGMASRAFYWIERRGQHRAFFRLPFGGAYGHGSEDAAEVVRFLEGYRDFRHELGARLASSTLVHSMGNARFELRLREPDGSTRELADDGEGIPRLPNRAPMGAAAFWDWMGERATAGPFPPATS